jgi:hypothetical protein
MSYSAILLAIILLFLGYRGVASADEPCLEPPPPPPRVTVSTSSIPLENHLHADQPWKPQPDGPTKEQLQQMERSGRIKIFPGQGMMYVPYQQPRAKGVPCPPDEQAAQIAPIEPPATPAPPSEVPHAHPIEPNSPE